MFKLLKLLFSEKLLLIICIIFILFSAFFTVTQIGIFTSFNKMFLTSSVVEKIENSDSNESRDFREMSFSSQITFLYNMYSDEGKTKVFEFLQSEHDRSVLFIFFIFAILLLGLYQIFNFLRTYTADILAIKVTSRLRQSIFSKLIYFPSTFFKDNSSGDVISKTLNDVNLINQYTINVFSTLLFSPIIIIASLFIMFMLDTQFTLIVLGMALFSVLVLSGLTSLLKKTVNKMLGNLADITGYLQKVFFGIDIVKIFNREKYEKNKFDNIVDKYVRYSKKSRAIVRINKPIIEMVGSITIMIILMLGVFQGWQAGRDSNQILNFIVILLVVSPHVQTLTNVIFLKQHLDVAMERVDKLLSEDPEKDKGGKPMKEFSGKVAFEKVTYRYPNTEKNVLNDVSFTVFPGEMVAFIGSSGCGKSTLMNLIPRLLSPKSGKIYFDDVDYEDFSTLDVRSHISMVSQNSILFPGTIMENIRYGNFDAEQSDIFAVTKQAAIHDFIVNLQDGYDTQVGELGTKLSGGQRQRICIARSILKHPKILLLDEATSALDSESEKLVQQAIEALIKNQTTFVVAHRLSTIVKADKIFVMDDGQIVEVGSHDELIKKDGFYKKLYDIQFS